MALDSQRRQLSVSASTVPHHRIEIQVFVSRRVKRVNAFSLYLNVFRRSHYHNPLPAEPLEGLENRQTPFQTKRFNFSLRGKRLS